MRSPEVKCLIQETLSLIKSRLKLPEGYICGFTSGSNTGAMEMALWNLITDTQAVSVYDTDPFSAIWARDITKLVECTVFRYDYGHTPQDGDFQMHDKNSDVVFVLNQTASGCYHRDLSWTGDGSGLAICDATSIVFAAEIDWSRLDVITLSLQKVLGGEAGVGIIILSPKAQIRLDQGPYRNCTPNLISLYNPDDTVRWNMFKDYPINTLSVAAIWEAYEILRTHDTASMIRNTHRNFNTVQTWVRNTDWANFLITDGRYLSPTVQCIRDPNIDMEAFHRELARSGYYDIKCYPGIEPNSIRIWTGPTVNQRELELLLRTIKSYVMRAK